MLAVTVDFTRTFTVEATPVGKFIDNKSALKSNTVKDLVSVPAFKTKSLVEAKLALVDNCKVLVAAELKP
jgi:hypothetical protein